ncbi:MAG TPA: RcpC/CpaB family pilus assembly protein [Baekduia sp.]|nr:RcpC/CpaB family pilus assembly protein [Baekduia sp.]
MSRRRRALVLAGLAVLLGALAASDVAGREAALRRSLGPTVPVVVARTRVPEGARLDARRLGLRRVPARYAPVAGYASIAALAGARAAIALEPGEDVVPAAVDTGRPQGAPVRAGERVAEIVARGAPELVRPGGRVDVLVTRETGDGQGSTTLALEDVEVLAAAPAPADAGDPGLGPRVAVSLRVTVRQAVFLAAAESFARELRVLPRAAGDQRRGIAGLTVGADLR